MFLEEILHSLGQFWRIISHESRFQVESKIQDVKSRRCMLRDDFLSAHTQQEVTIQR